MTARRRKALVGLLVSDLVGTLVARSLGYGVGGNTIVRCRRGHLFTTLWIPLVSVKSLRLGWWRIQRCPVGHHWSVVAPVRESRLTASQRRAARSRRDVRLP
jgi:hypothetical protein